ncbi:MAG: hypothetical protein HWE08_12525 [Alphaproteobacteria bacterium]|nr:hypothetical protein [Alphaproteobacteria bacterium]
MAQYLNIILVLIAALCFSVLLLPKIRRNPFWRATVTPLASIIGSGFLIIAPLLAAITGKMAIFAMMAILLVAYAVGGVMRYNIRHAEPRIKAVGAAPVITRVEDLGRVVLALAYIVSIAFYLRLMGSFVLDMVGLNTQTNAALLTSAVLLFIGISGSIRGLDGLEKLETASVSLKLAIIVALLVGLWHHDIETGFALDGLKPEHHTPIEQLRMLAGMLLVVQGFETSRYLANNYTATIRIRSMRLAQLVASVIYLLFLWLALPLMPNMEFGKPDETAIITLSAQAATVLPFMLVLAAVMSQFSAAVADTVGAGGLVEEQTDGRVTEGKAYLGVTLVGIFLVWSANIFEIVAIASRAFAGYYLLQTLIAARIVALRQEGIVRVLWLSGLLLLASVLLGTLLFALPVE